jgi:hypothetical protein
VQKILSGGRKSVKNVGSDLGLNYTLKPTHRCLLVTRLLVFTCLLVYPVYYPSKRVYVYLLLFTTLVNVFTFTAKQVNCLLCLKSVYFGLVDVY